MEICTGSSQEKCSSILHYGPLIETNNLYALTPNGQSVAKQKQYPLQHWTLYYTGPYTTLDPIYYWKRQQNHDGWFPSMSCVQ